MKGNNQSVETTDVAFVKEPMKEMSSLMVGWCFTPLLTVFQSYHGDSSHYSCFPGFHQY